MFGLKVSLHYLGVKSDTKLQVTIARAQDSRPTTINKSIASSRISTKIDFHLLIHSSFCGIVPSVGGPHNYATLFIITITYWVIESYLRGRMEETKRNIPPFHWLRLTGASEWSEESGGSCGHCSDRRPDGCQDCGHQRLWTVSGGVAGVWQDREDCCWLRHHLAWHPGQSWHLWCSLSPAQVSRDSKCLENIWVLIEWKYLDCGNDSYIWDIYSSATATRSSYLINPYKCTWRKIENYFDSISSIYLRHHCLKDLTSGNMNSILALVFNQESGFRISLFSFPLQLAHFTDSNDFSCQFTVLVCYWW